jgi:hypothetical protein
MGLLFIPQIIYEYGEPRWNNIDRGTLKNSEKTCPSATLSTKKLVWIDLGANLGLHGQWLATNCLNHGMATPIFSLPGWSQEMSHGFIVTPLKRFPNNDDIHYSVQKSQKTVCCICQKLTSKMTMVH